MHNKSLVPVKWAGQFGLSLVGGGVNVVPQWNVLMPDFSHQCTPPHPLRRHTHIQTDFGVAHPPTPPSTSTPFLPFPLPGPTQACDVTVSDNEVRILLQQSVRGWQRPGPLVVGRPLLTRLLSLGSSGDALQSGRSRVDLRMTSREWQCLSQPTPTATCRSRRHKGTQGCSRTALLRGGSAHSGGGHT